MSRRVFMLVGAGFLGLVLAAGLAAVLGAPDLRLRSLVIGSGGTSASSPSFGVLHTIGQSPIGESTETGLRAELGFWYGLSSDTDGDGVPDRSDNCGTLFNPDQQDSEQPPDGLGDVCDPDTTDSSTVSGVDGAVTVSSPDGHVAFAGVTTSPYSTVTIEEDASGIGTVVVKTTGQHSVRNKFDLVSSSLLTGTMTKLTEFPAPGISQTQLDRLSVEKTTPGGPLSMPYTIVDKQPPAAPYTEVKVSFDLADDATFTLLVPLDADGDGVFDQFDLNGDGDFADPGELDNCPLSPNLDQMNTDSGPPPSGTGGIGNGKGIAGDDGTVPNGDSLGDACDDDADNDGIPNTLDADPGGDITYDDNNNGIACPTDPADDGPSWDSNCNGVRDGVEAICPLTVNPSSDDDSDGIKNTWEVCKWGTNPNVVDSDGDGLGDCREAADVDGNGVVNFTGDVIYYAKAAMLPAASFGKDGDFDIDGNNIVNFTGDVVQEAKFALIPGLCK